MLWFLVLFLFTAPLEAKPSEDKVWVIVRPLQCMSNPWEKDWLKRNKNQVARYPRTQEFEVMKRFFAHKKVRLLEIRQKPYIKGDPFCETCNCPRGDTLFLLIGVDNVSRMVRLGYTERMAAQDVPQPQK